MRHRHLFRALALSCLLTGAASAANPDDAVAAATQRAARGGEGPYRALMTTDARLPTHTLYRPADLTAGAGRWPVIAWGNGACHNLGNRFRYFLTEIASHGYVVVAIGPIGAQLVESKVELTPEEAGRPAGARSTTNWRQLIEAINWAEAENAREGSAYRGRLDTSHIAVMGQSCGGLQAITASADPRVTTSVIWNSGTFDNNVAALDGTDATRESLAKLHAPIAYISGDSSDVAYKNSNADYALLPPKLPAFRAWAKGIGHTGTYREAGGGLFTTVAVDWLDWQLKGDRKAAKRFIGKDCGLCRDSGWVAESRNLD
jgi:dienelactone hydrolase